MDASQIKTTDNMGMAPTLTWEQAVSHAEVLRSQFGFGRAVAMRNPRTQAPVVYLGKIDGLSAYFLSGLSTP
jgi:hypothetical protein